MWIENTGTRVVGTGSGNRYPLNGDDRFYQTARCVLPPVPARLAWPTWRARAVRTTIIASTRPTRPTSAFPRRFTLADGLVLTVDPSIQWTSANGGTLGYTVSEKTTTINGVSGLTGYDGSTYYFGKDLNGDGDKLSTPCA
jgi:iron complex outermembrane receptor protein